MDCDIGAVATDDESKERGGGAAARKYLLLEPGPSLSLDFQTGQLTIAWIAGVFFFVLGILDAAAEHFRDGESGLDFGRPAYIVLKIAVVVSFVLFQRGFIVLGAAFNNYLLRITSFLLIIGEIVVIGYDIASVFYDSVERGVVLGAEAFTFGGMLIIYGIALRRLRTTVGSVASYAGVFEILAGCFFLTIVLSLGGFFMLMPAELLEIVILYKSIGLLEMRRAPEAVGTVGDAAVA
jgi:hypothetical protein